MDVDRDFPTSSSSSGDVLSYFDLTPASFPWREHVFEEIEHRRALLSDTLLFDILLSLGGIKDADTLYPPADPDALKRLLTAIAECPDYDGLKRDGLIYYLLKWYHDGRETKFQRDRSVPPQFVALADAYWCLDSGVDIPRAVSQLSDRRLNRDYASKILQIISQTKDPHSLVVKYVRTAKPRLEEPDDIVTYTLALAQLNLFEAWQFQRTFNENDPTRERLLKKLIQWCVSPPNPSALTYLLTLPWSTYEENILHNYASSPSKDESLSATSIAILQNLACVRLIQIGKHAGAVKMHRSFIASLTSSKGKDTTTSTQTLFQERDEMIQEVYHALPAVERNLLDAELESGGLGTIHQPVPISKSRPSMFGSGNLSRIRQESDTLQDAGGDISMSWEDIPRPPLSSSINGIAKPPSPSRPGSGSHTPLNFSLSTAPKFGGSIYPSSNVSTTASLGSSTSQKIDGLPPPTLSSTALNLFGASTSNSTKRKSGGFPLFSTTTSDMGFGGNSLSLSSSTRPPIIPTTTTPSMNVNGGDDTLGFGFGMSTSTNPFSSSARRENAFFRPQVQQNGKGRGSGSRSGRRMSSGSASLSPERPAVGENEDGDIRRVDETMEVDDLNPRDEAGLNYSVFSGKKKDVENGLNVISRGWEQPPQNQKQTRKSRGGDGHGHGHGSTSISVLNASSSSKLPGAFMEEEEEEEDEHDPEQARETRRSSRVHHNSSAQGQPRQTRGSKKSTAPATSASARGGATSSKQKSSARQSISAGMKRSVPGAMYDDEEDDDGASSVQSDVKPEDDDILAPLPTRRAPRKTHTSTLVDEDAGAGATKTRRRSSRLSTTSNDAASSSRKSTGKRASKTETSGKSRRKR